MTVVYKSCRKHSDADCLSRVPVESAPSCAYGDDDEVFIGAVNDQDMANLQRYDPELRVVMDHLQGRESGVPRVVARHLSGFVIRRGVLFKNNFGTSTLGWLLVIPSSLREEIFQGHHDYPTARHLGYSRILVRIREKYNWPRLPKTVHCYARSCHECQWPKETGDETGRTPAVDCSSDNAISADRYGFAWSLSTVDAGNRWMIVATDYLTRYDETKALPSGTGVEVAMFFIESIVLRHGAPEVLITEQGSSLWRS